MRTPEEIAALLEGGDREAAGVALNHALMELHGSGAAATLCALHRIAVEYWKPDAEQMGFHLTHAYVYALEAGDDAQRDALFTALRGMGRI